MSRLKKTDAQYILISETMTVPSLMMMMTAIVSEELLVRDRHTHADTFSSMWTFSSLYDFTEQKVTSTSKANEENEHIKGKRSWAYQRQMHVMSTSKRNKIKQQVGVQRTRSWRACRWGQAPPGSPCCRTRWSPSHAAACGSSARSISAAGCGADLSHSRHYCQLP